jgi:hypothetical protein
MEFSIDDIIAKGKKIDKDTLEARDYIIEEIRKDKERQEIK